MLNVLLAILIQILNSLSITLIILLYSVILYIFIIINIIIPISYRNLTCRLRALLGIGYFSGVEAIIDVKCVKHV